MSTRDKRILESDWATLAAVSAWRLPLRWPLTGWRRPRRAGCAPRVKNAATSAGLRLCQGVRMPSDCRKMSGNAAAAMSAESLEPIESP